MIRKKHYKETVENVQFESMEKIYISNYIIVNIGRMK